MREFSLLEHIYARNSRLGSTVLIGPGDDLGMVEIPCVGSSDRAALLAGVDQLVGGQHFDPQVTPIDRIAHKAVARSLSDVAAMAARPVGALAGVTLPTHYTEKEANELFDAMAATAERFDCPLLGGDIAMHENPGAPLVCSITVFAVPIDDDHPPRVRSAARAGDTVYVTGVLGGSYDEQGLGRHLEFEPRIREAIELSRALGANLHALIDISDGLGRDLGHVARASSVSIEIDADRVPCAVNLDWKRAVSDGEDYELAFTADEPPPPSIGDLRITRVGRVVESSASQPVGRVLALADGATLDITEHGWQHQTT